MKACHQDVELGNGVELRWMNTLRIVSTGESFKFQNRKSCVLLLRITTVYYYCVLLLFFEEVLCMAEGAFLTCTSSCEILTILEMFFPTFSRSWNAALGQKEINVYLITRHPLCDWGEKRLRLHSVLKMIHAPPPPSSQHFGRKMEVQGSAMRGMAHNCSIHSVWTACWSKG